jgi:YD repeat-containing protein
MNDLSSSIIPPEQILININNLRTQLPDAQITTYTYKPLVGMTSMTDPRGVKIFYEYDDFNRLKCIKDNNGNIIQKFDYHYKE